MVPLDYPSLRIIVLTLIENIIGCKVNNRSQLIIRYILIIMWVCTFFLYIYGFMQKNYKQILVGLLKLS